MSNGIIQELYKQMSEGNLPEDVSGQMTLAAVMEILTKVNEVSDTVNKLDGRVEQLEKHNNQSPSLLWLIRNQPASTTLKQVVNLVAVMLVILYLLSHVPSNILYSLLGVPIP